MLGFLKVLVITNRLDRVILLNKSRGIRVDIIETILSLIIFDLVDIDSRVANLNNFMKVGQRLMLIHLRHA